MSQTLAVLALTTLLLSPIAASAQTPNLPVPREKLSAAPVSAADLRYRKIILQHTNPFDLLRMMHWEKDMAAMDPFKSVQGLSSSPLTDTSEQGQGGRPTYAPMPEGVARIFALQSNNSLLLQATDAGYKQVQEIVKTLDIAPPRVKLTARFITVPLSQKLMVDLSHPSQTLLQLYTANALFSEPISQTADNDTPVDFFDPWPDADPQNMSGSTLIYRRTVRLTPRINKDSSVTLSLNAEGPREQVSEIIRTVPSGGAAVYGMTPWLPPGKNRVFLFITPTILGADTNSDNITLTP